MVPFPKMFLLPILEEAEARDRRWRRSRGGGGRSRVGGNGGTKGVRQGAVGLLAEERET
jgi:hypothetical protein